MKTPSLLLLATSLTCLGALAQQSTPPPPPAQDTAPDQPSAPPPRPPGEPRAPRENRGPGDDRAPGSPRGSIGEDRARDDHRPRPDRPPGEGGERHDADRERDHGSDRAHDRRDEPGRDREMHGPRMGGDAPGGIREHEGRDGRDDRGREMPRHFPSVPPSPQPFLGVVTAPVPALLSAQLGLPEGFGLLVQDVLPNSPAATAGLQKYDVLKMLNDQQLIDVAQLATLVRAAGKDKEVALTIVRQSKEQKITAKVGEHLAPFGGPGGHGILPPEFYERIHRFQEEMRRSHGAGSRPEGGRPPMADLPPEEILHQAQPGGGSELQVLTTAGLATLDSAKSRLLVTDRAGVIEVAAENGQRVLTARDPQGKVIFTGPVDTEEQRQAIPPELRNRLEKIHVKASLGQPSPLLPLGAEAPVASVQ